MMLRHMFSVSCYATVFFYNNVLPPFFLLFCHRFLFLFCPVRFNPPTGTYYVCCTILLLCFAIVFLLQFCHRFFRLYCHRFSCYCSFPPLSPPILPPFSSPSLPPFCSSFVTTVFPPILPSYFLPTFATVYSFSQFINTSYQKFFWLWWLPR